MIIRANYELNGISCSKDFVQERGDVRHEIYDWLKEIAESEGTFKYLGSEMITVLEIGQADDEVASTMTVEVIEPVEEEFDETRAIFEEVGPMVKKPRMSSFENWFRTFIDEKDLPVVEWSYDHANYIGVFVDNYDAVEVICNMTPQDQLKVKTTLVKLDFMNGDVNHFLKHIMDAYIEMQ